MEWQDRTQLLLGSEALKILEESHVLVAGLGGVGGMLAEMLCRAGIGHLTLVDGDAIQKTNLNRQIPSLHSNIGQAKTQVVAQRLKDINPNINLQLVSDFIRDDFTADLLSQPFDYVADAIDTLSPKLHLIRLCMEKGHKLVSSMGAGGKLDPEQVRIADISESHHCRLAYNIRKRLHRLGIFNGFTVVFSPEPVPNEATMPVTGEQNKITIIGTVSYMPPIFGCYMASVIIRDLINKKS